jgi:hypothetical protein
VASDHESVAAVTGASPPPDQSQPDVLTKRTEDGLRQGRGDPEHCDQHAEDRRTRIEPLLKSREGSQLVITPALAPGLGVGDPRACKQLS